MTLWEQEQVDPHYTRFYTSLRDEEGLTQMVQPVIEKFAKMGFRTAIVMDRQGEGYCVHCLAIRILKGKPPEIITQKASSQITDSLQLQAPQAAEIEPLGVRFGKLGAPAQVQHVQQVQEAFELVDLF